MSNTPRIFVRCLATYNAGEYHGKWIDVDANAEGEIAALLRSSPYPNVRRDCPECIDSPPFNTIDPDCDICKGVGSTPSAESWAIHGSEGFGGYEPGESANIDRLIEVAELIEQHGDVFTVAMNYFDDLDDATSALEDRYRGEWGSLADYAENFAEECDYEAMKDMPDRLKQSIDWSQYATWLDVTELDAGGGNVHIFSDH